MMSDTTQDDRNATPPETDRIDDTPVADRTDDGEAATARPLGFIGLGAMGLPMAVRVAGAHGLLGCDTDPMRLARLREMTGDGGRVHTTPVPAEVGARCDIIALMLPTAEIDPVLAALAETLAPGGVLIDLAPSPPTETRRRVAEMLERGIHLIDAAPCGTEAEALDGTLTMLAAGTEADLARAAPFLDVLSKRVIRTGPVGSAHAAGALAGFIQAASLLATTEAIRIASASGLDAALMAATLGSLPARSEMVGGTLADLEIAAGLSDEADGPDGNPGEALAACLSAWRRAIEELGPNADNADLYRPPQA